MVIASAPKRVVRFGLVAVPAVPTAGVVAGATAYVEGTSPSANGRHVQRWNAAWEAECEPAAASGGYRAVVAQASQPDIVGPLHSVGEGSVVNFDYGFDYGNAWLAVQGDGSWVGYRG